MNQSDKTPQRWLKQESFDKRLKDFRGGKLNPDWADEFLLWSLDIASCPCLGMKYDLPEVKFVWDRISRNLDIVREIASKR